MNAIWNFNAARMIAPGDQKIAEFVAEVSTQKRETWLSYIALMGLNEHLARFVPMSPFVAGTHLDQCMGQLISRFLPFGHATEHRQFLFAMQKHVRDNKLIKKEFEYCEPDEFCFCRHKDRNQPFK